MKSLSIAIVTGASSGLGKEFVRLLCAQEGVEQVWAIARNQNRLDELKSEFGEKIVAFSLDLSINDSIQNFERTLNEQNPKILFLVNNAGFAKFGAYSDVEISESVNMIDLNCSSVVAMGLVCLPYMGVGSRIINIASMSAFFPLPYLAIYAATKAFVRSYSRSLNVELKERGVSVTAVCPGWIETNFYGRANIGADKSVSKYSFMSKPVDVAKKAFKDAQKGKDMSTYGTFTKFTRISAKLLPQKWLMKIWLIQQNWKA